jgi:hypothetical protein
MALEKTPVGTWPYFFFKIISIDLEICLVTYMAFC